MTPEYEVSISLHLLYDSTVITNSRGFATVRIRAWLRLCSICWYGPRASVATPKLMYYIEERQRSHKLNLKNVIKVSKSKQNKSALLLLIKKSPLRS